jgi:hypothetical protein
MERRSGGGLEWWRVGVMEGWSDGTTWRSNLRARLATTYFGRERFE